MLYSAMCFLPGAQVGERQSRGESGGEGHVSGLERVRTLRGPAAYLAQELGAVPQPTLPAYSNIYDHFLAGESN